MLLYLSVKDSKLERKRTKREKKKETHLNLTVMNVIQKCVVLCQRPGGKSLPTTFVHRQKPSGVKRTLAPCV